MVVFFNKVLSDKSTYQAVPFLLRGTAKNMFMELSEISSQFGVGLNQSINDDEAAVCELP